MQFGPPPSVNRLPSVTPLLAVSLLATLIVLAIACLSLSHEEDFIRLPITTLPRPPISGETPTISIRMSRQGVVTLGGQVIADNALITTLQHECGALRLLGFEPTQATVVVYADRDVTTAHVQELIEKAQSCGFSRCVLRTAELSNVAVPSQGPRP
jgi:biopolymer transport protein ExbD